VQAHGTRLVTAPIFLRIDGQETGLPRSGLLSSFSGPTSTQRDSR
jgi:hypothetical protein